MLLCGWGNRSNIDGSYLKFQTVAFNALHSFDQIVIKPLLPNSTILSFSVFSSYYTVWFFLSLPNENLALILTLPLSLRCVCLIYIYDNLFLYSYFFIYFLIICFIKLESTPLVMEKYDMAWVACHLTCPCWPTVLSFERIRILLLSFKMMSII
jgi:hypothetical protein